MAEGAGGEARRRTPETDGDVLRCSGLHLHRRAHGSGGADARHSTYFQAVTDDLIEHHATIDKYIGDAVMAIWNAPKRDLAHALHGCRAALHARALTLRLEDEFAARGWPRLHTLRPAQRRCGGGHVGSNDRMAYTAIGSMVNIGIPAGRHEQAVRHADPGVGGDAAWARAAASCSARWIWCRRRARRMRSRCMSWSWPVGGVRPEGDAVAGRPRPGRSPAGLGEAIRCFRAGQFTHARAGRCARPATPRRTRRWRPMWHASRDTRMQPRPAGWSPVTRLDSK